MDIKNFNRNIFSSLVNVESLTMTKKANLSSIPENNKITHLQLVSCKLAELNLNLYTNLIMLDLQNVSLEVLDLAKVREVHISSNCTIGQIRLPDENNLVNFSAGYFEDVAFLKKAIHLQELTLIHTKITNDHLSNLSKLNKLELTNVEGVDNLTSLTNLKILDHDVTFYKEDGKNYALPKLPASLMSLKITFYPDDTDNSDPIYDFSLANVSNLPQLEKLNINLMSCNLHLEEVTNCPNITQLTLKGAKIYGAKTLRNYLLLSSLLTKGELIESPSRLRANRLLKKVEFIKPDLSDLKCLKDSSIEELIIFRSPIKDLTPLANCHSLRNVSISKCGDLTNIDTLFQLPNLQKAAISYSGVSKQTLLKLSTMFMDRPE